MAEMEENMQINLTSENMETIFSSLKNSKQDLKRQVEKYTKIDEPRKAEIAENQLKEVEEVLTILEEELYKR